MISHQISQFLRETVRNKIDLVFTYIPHHFSPIYSNKVVRFFSFTLFSLLTKPPQPKRAIKNYC